MDKLCNITYDLRPSYYYDGEWVHTKLVGEYDLYEAGSFVSDEGDTITFDRDQTERRRLCHRVTHPSRIHNLCYESSLMTSGAANLTR